MKNPDSRVNGARAEHRLVLLGAGRPWRGYLPSAVQTIAKDTRVLDWLLAACKGMPSHFVGGYRFSDVTEKYPALSTSHNTQWKDTGSVASLLLAPASSQPTIVSYTDIVVRSSVVDQLLAAPGDVVIAVDTQWKQSAVGRSQEDISHMEMLAVQNDRVVPSGQQAEQAEFAGMMKLSSKALALLEKNKEWLNNTYPTAHLAALAEWFLFQKLDVRVVDISGNWTELNTPSDLAQFLLGTKFETLHRLSGVLTCSHICEHVGFTTEKWKKNTAEILQEIQKKFSDQKVIIRSSATGEDSWTASQAGKYESVADIDANDKTLLAQTIDTVIAAYGDTNPHDQVLVEPFLSPVKMSGVAFTRSLKYRAPYYVINYDNKSQRTDTVTSGSSGALQSYTLLRDQEPPNTCPDDIRALLAAIKEIETIVGHNSLDIEFAITPDDKIYVLQVRPLTAKEERWRGGYSAVQGRVAQAKTDYEAYSSANTHLHGKPVIFGAMPDWNPAEIIGVRPTRLAESLYRHLVTDETWATQRAEFGYHDVRPYPLMHSFAGHSYIDVRASFNSFIPAALDDELKEKLVSYYLSRLAENPNLHDKIEFDIALTCLDLSFDKKANVLAGQGFSGAEISALKDALTQINHNALARYKADASTVAALLTQDVASDYTNAPLSQAMRLLDECKTSGVLPFAHLARAAFIAMALLKSAVFEGVITEAQMNGLLASLDNVTSRLRADARKVHDGALSWDDFVSSYGHLRPGSYNIATPAYGDDPEYYLRPLVSNAKQDAQNHTPHSLPWDTIAQACKQNGLDVSAGALEGFICKAIEGREQAKFIFMRHVNAALQIVKQYGKQHGFTAEELAHLDLADLRGLASGHHSAAQQGFMRDAIERNQLEYDICLGVELPPLICSGEDFIAFDHLDNAANFIGSASVSAKVSVLRQGNDAHEDLNGKIVLITQADPGWDWIFGYDIAALVTAWGGANSHMAIRAAELDIPAVIGIGEEHWQHVAQARELYVNCATKQMKVLL